jgi:aryl-alcohol dehydrogenase-like predicted oxidoreductase
MIRVRRLDRDVSVLGFGCAPLGSRISASRGRRAIDYARDHGVNWFDVAPPYGDGQAESLLGQAMRTCRADVVICTKFGIEPSNVPLAAHLMRPLARRAVAAFPGLRRVASKARPTGERVPINSAVIEASVTRSLRLLRTDYIDVLAIHEPTLEDATNAEIFDVLRRLLERGLVRAISVAGDPASVEAAVRTSDLVDIAQFPDNPFRNAAADLRRRLPAPAPLFVTHGVFGSGATKALAGMTAQQQAQIAGLALRHGIDPAKSLADLPLRLAFSNNPDGVVIISMFDTKHIERNIAAAGLPAISGFDDEVRRSLA